MSIQNKLKKCFDEGKKGGERHQGLRKVDSSTAIVKDYLEKAKHNFEAITSFHDIGYSDWAASAAFYSLYHCLLAMLAQRGIESRNQSCTFAYVESLILKKQTKYLGISDLKEIFDKDVSEDLAHSQKIIDVRERMQYSTRTGLAEQEFELIKKRTKQLFDKIRLEIEEYA